MLLENCVFTYCICTVCFHTLSQHQLFSNPPWSPLVSHSNRPLCLSPSYISAAVWFKEFLLNCAAILGKKTFFKQKFFLGRKYHLVKLNATRCYCCLLFRLCILEICIHMCIHNFFSTMKKSQLHLSCESCSLKILNILNNFNTSKLM